LANSKGPKRQGINEATANKKGQNISQYERDGALSNTNGKSISKLERGEHLPIGDSLSQQGRVLENRKEPSVSQQERRANIG
jgi:hypothetical protein